MRVNCGCAGPYVVLGRREHARVVPFSCAAASDDTCSRAVLGRNSEWPYNPQCSKFWRCYANLCYHGGLPVAGGAAA